MSIYTNPPAWIRKKGYDTILTKNGWVAIYPNGKQELVVALRNVPEKYLTSVKSAFREHNSTKSISEPTNKTVSNADETKEKASVSVSMAESRIAERSIAESSIAESSITETEKKSYSKKIKTKAI